MIRSLIKQNKDNVKLNEYFSLFKTEKVFAERSLRR